MAGEYWDDLPPVPDEVTIPRSQYKALMGAAEVVIDMAAGALKDCGCRTCQTAAALRAAGILEEGT